MSDRIVRDELLTSERYWSVSSEARNLFVSILLTVDDAARMAASNFALRTKCMAGTVTHDRRIEKILMELVDVDLVRLYEVDGARYIFVPRFRNRRRYVSRSKHPEPPKGINDINDITEKKDDSSHPQVIPKSGPVCTQVIPKTRGVGVGVGVGEGKRKNGTHAARFVQPSLEELREYIAKQGYGVDAQKFIDHYLANGWKVGRNQMRDWRAAVRMWEARERREIPSERVKL